MAGFHFSFILGMSESSARVEIHRGGWAGKEGWEERSSVRPGSGCLCENTTLSSCSGENGRGGGSGMILNQMLLVFQKLATCNLGLHKPSIWLCFSLASSTSQGVIQVEFLLYLTVKLFLFKMLATFKQVPFQ